MNKVLLAGSGESWTVEELVCLGLLLLFTTHFYIPILQPVQSSLFAASSDDQTMLGQCICCTAWAVAGIVMLRNWLTIVAQFRRLGLILAFVLLAIMSAAWSQDPSITLRKSGFLLLTTGFGVYFASRYSIPRQMRLLCISALAAASLSIGLALLLPKYGVDHDAHEGVWVGIFTQKNVCAREMLFLLASVLPFQPRTRALGRCRFAAVVAMITVIIATQSRTALLIMVLLLLAFPCLAFVRFISRGIVLIVAACLTLGLLASYSLLPGLVLLLGRDGTLTGRTEIWKAVMQAIMKHPLLGYGFAAFWLSLRGESANVILALRWAVPAAHNGFLEIWLQLGAAGLILFLSGFLFSLRSACKGMYQPSFSAAAWPLAILLLTLLYNLDESSLMQPNDLLWVLYVATLVNLAKPKIKHDRIEARSAGSGILPLLQSASHEAAASTSSYLASRISV